MKSTFGKKLIRFYSALEFDIRSKEIQVMNPYKSKDVIALNTLFADKYFSDNKKRHFLFGINPGRFGSGVTGISFTDPIRLQEICGIENAFQKKPELSSQFVYTFIEAYGVEKFYNAFFISALCPLGFLKDGKNMNYYDNKKLHQKTEPFIIETLKHQIAIGAYTDRCICLGEGANYKYFSKLNEQHHFFDEIIPLPHPRWIMQYRRKKMREYVQVYLDALKGCLSA